jgi:hypothetical protein
VKDGHVWLGRLGFGDVEALVDPLSPLAEDEEGNCCCGKEGDYHARDYDAGYGALA